MPRARSATLKPPSYTRTISKTHTHKVEQKGSTKVTTRTMTRTKILVLVEEPQSTPHPSDSNPVHPADDSDDPNDDAQISFATDSESEMSSSPTPDQSCLSDNDYLTARSQSSHPRRFTPSTSAPSTSTPSLTGSHPAPGTANTSNDKEVIAFYNARYPGRVPHPEFYNGSNTNCSQYYVVTGGKSVGMFTDWSIASDLVSGVRHAKYQSYPEYYQAWLAYQEQWATKKLRVLGTYQDTAPLSTQIADSGLESSIGNLTL
ncbi:hypothetical protein AAF712_015630 [Marasmius tenuissimus]|uniref:Ribonuclease H1 N-terminal domain-containing protein n=1 Tax=Marasmius tenuissimus TaxID=585030 RepID=A0ABR2Z8P1_9AGAR